MSDGGALVILGGTLGTVLVLMFALIWWVDDLLTAMFVIGFTILGCVAVVGIFALWAWVAAGVLS